MVSQRNTAHYDTAFQVRVAEFSIEESRILRPSKYLIIEECRYRASWNSANCGVWDSGFIENVRAYVYHEVLPSPYPIHSSSMNTYGVSLGYAENLVEAENMVRESLIKYYQGLVTFSGFTKYDLDGEMAKKYNPDYPELFTDRKNPTI